MSAYADAVDYVPSGYVENLAKPWPCTGLKRLVDLAHAEGYKVYIDFDEGPDSLELVTSANARKAAHEVDMAYFHFVRDGELVGVVLCIPENGEDWLSDYHVSLDPLIDRM